MSRILFTGFTSRTVGGNSLYDYLSNVEVLYQTLKRAGHEVDRRRVSLEERNLTDSYDLAFIGIAACNGLSSRYKLGALHAACEFGQRAILFPSDGRNVGQFVNSVRTSYKNVGTFLGDKLGDRNNIVDHEVGSLNPDYWKTLLGLFLTGSERKGKNPWTMLVPTFSWGSPDPYAYHLQMPAHVWDPTNLAWPLQFETREMMPELETPREKRWVMPTLQDQDGWLNKQHGEWDVIQIGNKRKGQAFIPELQMIEDWYRTSVGTLAFGYPMSKGGWWRMRYIHAAIAGCIVCADPEDQRVAGGPYIVFRSGVETMTPEQRIELARKQHAYLFEKAWPAERAIEAVDDLVRRFA